MSISVKSYLISDESSDTSEIRRFVLETTSGSSLFQKLQEQLQKLYSCTKAKELAIQWKGKSSTITFNLLIMTWVADLLNRTSASCLVVYNITSGPTRAHITTS